MTKLISQAEIPSKTELAAVVDTIEPPNVSPIVDQAETSDIDVGKALSLRLKNKLSYAKIGELLNVPKTTVYDNLKWIESLIANPAEIEAYDSNRAMLLTAAELMILKELANGGSVQKASANNLAFVYDKLTNARRLEQDKATSNVSHHHMTTEISEIDKELRELEAERGGL
jgi:hypothetical protein